MAGSKKGWKAAPSLLRDMRAVYRHPSKEWTWERLKRLAKMYADDPVRFVTMMAGLEKAYMARVDRQAQSVPRDGAVTPAEADETGEELQEMRRRVLGESGKLLDPDGLRCNRCWRLGIDYGCSSCPKWAGYCDRCRRLAIRQGCSKCPRNRRQTQGA